VAICGNGASAALLLCALARLPGLMSVVVIGNGAKLGAGIAYATSNPHHLLNVPATRMSADPRDPRHFQNWLTGQGIDTENFADQFVPRALYARYLDHVTKSTLSTAPHCEVRFVPGEVRSLIPIGSRWKVWHGDGGVFADLVVLATGNDMPAPIAQRYAGEIANRIIDNPWGGLTAGPGEDVLVLGSGLTAVDTVISLLDAGHEGGIHLLSRRGLLPARHVPPDHRHALSPPYPKTARSILAAMRRATGHHPTPEVWQGLMDNLRAHGSQIWQDLPLPEKQRFLRHGATHWGVHRHRLAPKVADRIEAALARNVRVLRGRLGGLATDGAGRLAATILQRGKPRLLGIDRVVNCTGPNSDPYKSQALLIENIVASRLARRGPAHLGLEIDVKNRVIDRDGLAQPTLFAIGALTRDRWWEITAIPEISRQAAELAGHIAQQLRASQIAREKNGTEFRVRRTAAWRGERPF
jgi:uncharacterized NAD(P)/FAD-binding protein YdhS